jgi:hypothetical protein
MWPFLQTTNTNCDCEPASSNQCGCSKISSLDIAYNGPDLVCSGIVLCDSLSVALQKIEEKICTAGNISGVGINNYVARWTPDGNTLGTGLIQDNGITTSINTALDNTWLFKMTTSSQRFTQRVENTYVSSIPGNNSISLTAFTNGANTGGSNIAVVAISSNSVTENTGVAGRAVGVSVLNNGGNFEAIGGTTNVGSKFYAANGINNYAIQLQDNTQGTGKFLKSVTINGHANWANITTSDISGFPSNIVGGTGTNNFTARWTPNGSTLGTGIIQDNGDTLSIGTPLSSNVLLNISTNKIAGIFIANTNTDSTIRNAISAITNGVSDSENRGIEGLAMNSTDLNTGISGNAISNVGSKAVGGAFSASGTGTNYALQLRDGTQDVGKVLTCMSIEGEASWVTPSGVSGSGTNNFVARWTPDNVTLGAGILQDDGVSLGVNMTPESTTTLLIKTTGEQQNGIYSINDAVVDGIKNSIYGFTTGANTSENRGIEAFAQGSSYINRGVLSIATSLLAGKAVGGAFFAQGPGTNYAIQLMDSTAEIDKVLICVTENGEANWGKVTSNNTTGATDTFISQDGKTVTVSNGLIISIV